MDKKQFGKEEKHAARKRVLSEGLSDDEDKLDRELIQLRKEFCKKQNIGYSSELQLSSLLPVTKLENRTKIELKPRNEISLSRHKLADQQQQIQIDMIQLEGESGRTEGRVVVSIDEMINIFKTSSNDDNELEIKWILVKVKTRKNKKDKTTNDAEKVMHNAFCCACSKTKLVKKDRKPTASFDKVPKKIVESGKSNFNILEKLLTQKEKISVVNYDNIYSETLKCKQDLADVNMATNSKSEEVSANHDSLTKSKNIQETSNVIISAQSDYNQNVIEISNQTKGKYDPLFTDIKNVPKNICDQKSTDMTVLPKSKNNDNASISTLSSLSEHQRRPENWKKKILSQNVFQIPQISPGKGSSLALNIDLLARTSESSRKTSYELKHKILSKNSDEKTVKCSQSYQTDKNPGGSVTPPVFLCDQCPPNQTGFRTKQDLLIHQHNVHYISN